MLKFLSPIILVLSLAPFVFPQKAKPSRTPVPKPRMIRGTGDVPARGEEVVSIMSSGDYLEEGIFRSTNGKFSIAIPEFPTSIVDQAHQKAKAKSIDVGKQFVWILGKTVYTVYYTPPVNLDGDPLEQRFADIENGTRKGVLNAGATILSEKPVKFGTHRGTEFRYKASNGVQFINRVFLIGDRGYQIMGCYGTPQDEPKVIDVLNSFKLAHK